MVLGANGTMGYGSAALFTKAVPKVTMLARTTGKAEDGLRSAIGQVRSETVSRRVECADYDELERAVASADLVFEAVAEDAALKGEMFERVDEARRPHAIVATVSSGLSINSLAADRSEGFRSHFCGLHFFNPPNVIVGTELIAGDDTDREVLDFVETFAVKRLGREVVRANDTPAFAGNRVGFKVLNEAAQLASEIGPLAVDRVLGPYTGRAMTPLATIDLVGWDVHQAIVDNVYANTDDEARSTLRLPDYMARLIADGVLGDKSGRGFYTADGDDRLVIDPVSGDYAPADDAAAQPDHVQEITGLYSEGRYREGMAVLLASDEAEAELSRRMLAGYISYAFERVGEVCESIDVIDRIMATGFNWAPPSVLVDVMSPGGAVAIIEEAELVVPDALGALADADVPGPTFDHSAISPGRYFVAA